MVDNDNKLPPRDNIRTLLYRLGVELDERIAEIRKTAPFPHVRPSDVRVFLFAAEGDVSMSDIARALGISRQAVHMSTRRLKDLGVIALTPSRAGKRDLVVSLTERGRLAREQGSRQVALLEKELAEVLGEDGVQILRRTLLALIHHVEKKNGQARPVATRPV